MRRFRGRKIKAELASKSSSMSQKLKIVLKTDLGGRFRENLPYMGRLSLPSGLACDSTVLLPPFPKKLKPRTGRRHLPPPKKRQEAYGSTRPATNPHLFQAEPGPHDSMVKVTLCDGFKGNNPHWLTLKTPRNSPRDMQDPAAPLGLELGLAGFPFARSNQG